MSIRSDLFFKHFNTQIVSLHTRDNKLFQYFVLPLHLEKQENWIENTEKRSRQSNSVVHAKRDEEDAGNFIKIRGGLPMVCPWEKWSYPAWVTLEVIQKLNRGNTE